MLISLQNVFVIDNEWIVIKIQNYIILLTEWISVTSLCVWWATFLSYIKIKINILKIVPVMNYHIIIKHCILYVTKYVNRGRWWCMKLYNHTECWQIIGLLPLEKKCVKSSFWILSKEEIVKFLSWSQVSVFNLIDSSIWTSYLSFWTMKWIKRNM